MAPPRKSVLWNRLKEAISVGYQITIDKPYVEYTEAELNALVEQHGLSDENIAQAVQEPVSAPERPAPGPEPTPAPQPPAAAAPAHHAPQAGERPAALAARLGVPLSDRGADRAGLTFNSHGPDDPVRVDTQGRVWYQDEVPKPAIPKRRMIRKVRTVGSDVRMEELRDREGRLIESFEVPGSERREVEVSITLPSWQVGIYKDPRFPFRIHQYNDQRGFDYQEIVQFYGGLDLVPSSIKRLYVGNDLCFDIKSTHDTMEKELRDATLGRRFA